MWERLTKECGADVAEATVWAHVAKVRFELDNHSRAVTVPQTHGPGEEAEVDFGAFSAWIAGVLVELWMFCMRLSHSGRGFHLAFANQAQEAFLEGHVEAFEHFGGVPVGHIRYDNLKPAVIKVLLGRARLENPRFVALRSHYGFDSFYCEPGVKGAHEKGGVEGEIGRFRRGHLVPVPRVASLAELNEVLATADAGDDDRTIAWRTTTVGEMAAAEAAWLRPLPADVFDTASTLWPIVDTKARICVRQSLYSVPAGLSRRRVEVRLGARSFSVVADGKVVARHQRSLHKGEEELVLDHYLEILVRKPGALPGSTALAQARASGAFGATHDAFREAARRRWEMGPAVVEHQAGQRFETIGFRNGARRIVDLPPRPRTPTSPPIPLRRRGNTSRRVAHSWSAAPNRFRIVSRACVRAAVEIGAIATDPWAPRSQQRARRKVARRRRGIDVRSLPGPETMARAIDAITTHQPGSRKYRVMTAVAYYAGLRPSEVVMLRSRALVLPSDGWGRISVTEADISFDESGEPKTGPRTVPVPPVLVTILRQWIEENGFDSADDVLFRTRGGKRPSASNWCRAWHRALATVGQEPLRVYDCRHAAATTWLRAGVPLAAPE